MAYAGTAEADEVVEDHRSERRHPVKVMGELCPNVKVILIGGSSLTKVDAGVAYVSATPVN